MPQQSTYSLIQLSKAARKPSKIIVFLVGSGLTLIVLFIIFWYYGYNGEFFPLMLVGILLCMIGISLYVKRYLNEFEENRAQFYKEFLSFEKKKSSSVNIEWNTRKHTNDASEVVYARSDLDLPKPSFRLRRKKKEICHICHQIILIGDERAICPGCHSIFHFGHFGEWVHQKGKCPVCNEEIVMD
ncbi:MAG: hypothetical protein ACFFFH_16510 [Candidatus Thorarchaeota archaeon]